MTDSKLYPMNKADYSMMHSLQSGLCAMCHEAPKDGQLLEQDHDHTSGEVRGLLCRRCNIAVGAVEAVGELALIYLSQHRYTDAELCACLDEVEAQL